MMVFPNAKINLGLHVTSRRPDGFHNLETCFYPVPVTDVLELRPARHFSLREEGKPSGCKPVDNLCYKAWHLLQQAHGIDPVEMILYKELPNGAGLGGGSADAAFTLKALNTIYQLGLDQPQLEEYAAKLGSDCAFFISNKPVMATGRGTDFSPINLSLKGRWILLIWPGFGVSTKEAYGGVKPQQPAHDLTAVLGASTHWRDQLVNDFEAGIFQLHPRLAQLKQQLYDKGAFYAAMSGSGSTIFGLFDQKPSLSFFQRAGYWVKAVQLG